MSGEQEKICIIPETSCGNLTVLCLRLDNMLQTCIYFNYPYMYMNDIDWLCEEHMYVYHSKKFL